MSRYLLLLGLGLVLALASVDFFGPSWPDTPRHEAFAAASGNGEITKDEVADLPVCVASKGWSAGELGKTVLYRARRDGNRLSVGYFVYWSNERPWANNSLSYAVLPALATDAVYSHFLFVLPGIQRLLYGAGDVEGVRVTYERSSEGRWVPTRAVADNGCHRAVELGFEDFVDERGRVVVMTDVWSHQLGASNAVGSVRDGAPVVCFQGASIKPLPNQVARAFRLGDENKPRRAPPAWRLD